MDLLSLSFVALVVLLGGVVAFMADRLGRQLGKKRLRLFGLRPRHRAEVMTVAAGILIPLMTVGIVIAASSDVRTWITQGRAALHDRDRLDAEVADLTKREQTLSNQAKQTAAEIQVASEALRKSKGDAQAAKKESEALVKQAIALRGKIASAQKQLDLRRKDLFVALKNLQTTEKRYNELDVSYKTLDKQVREANDYARKLDQDNLKLGRDNDTLKDEVARRTAEREQLKVDIAHTQDELTKQRNELERTKIQVDQYAGRLSTYENQLNIMTTMFGQNLYSSRQQPMMFQKDEEVSRASVPEGLSGSDAARFVAQILHEARVSAESRGALARANGGMQSADLVERKDVTGRVISVEEQEQALAQAISGSKETLVIVASSAVNSFKGESVGLDLRVYRNPLVYRAGATVAEIKLNALSSEEDIFMQLNQFLQKNVRDQAIRAKMIPVNGQDGSFGALTAYEVAELVRIIKTHDRTVRVTAYVPTDTRAGDPLRLQFRIR